MAANHERVRGLDGLRGISALSVMLFHLKLLPIGWVGVEIFFVISGFLITRILLGEAQENTGMRFYLGRFFWRRGLRIFPLYYALVVVEICWDALVRGRYAFNGALLSQVTYTHNWYRALHVRSDPTMLGTHFWSLASEEQFYLVWPFVVYYFSRRGRFVYLALALVVISPLLRIGAWRLLPSDQVTWIVYHAGIFQVGPLAIGAVIACGFIPRVKRAWLWALCLTIAIATFGAYKNNLQDSFGFSVEMKAHHQWLWAYSAIDLIAAALVISCIQDEGIVEFLEWRPLKKLGQVSYGFYLLHPFVAFAVLPLAKQYSIRYGFAAGIAILLTWILAELSFVLFESRFLLMKNRYFARAVTKPQLMVVADTA